MSEYGSNEGGYACRVLRIDEHGVPKMGEHGVPRVQMNNGFCKNGKTKHLRPGWHPYIAGS